MNDIEKAVLKYLESRDDNGWKWVFGSRVMTKKETIEKFKKDGKFRRLIVEQVVALATDMFMKAAGEEKSLNG